MLRFLALFLLATLGFVETTEFFHAFSHEVEDACHSEQAHWCDDENHHSCDLCDYVHFSSAELPSAEQNSICLKTDPEEQIIKLEISKLYRELQNTRAPPHLA